MPVIGSMLSESMGSFLNLTSTVPSGCLSWGTAAVKTKIIRAENRTRSIDENHSGAAPSRFMCYNSKVWSRFATFWQNVLDKRKTRR